MHAGDLKKWRKKVKKKKKNRFPKKKNFLLNSKILPILGVHAKIMNICEKMKTPELKKGKNKKNRKKGQKK